MMGRDRELQLEDAIDRAATHLRKQNPVEALRVLLPHCSDEVMKANPPEVGSPGDKGSSAAPGSGTPAPGAVAPADAGQDDKGGEDRGREGRERRGRNPRRRSLF